MRHIALAGWLIAVLAATCPGAEDPFIWGPTDDVGQEGDGGFGLSPEQQKVAEMQASLDAGKHDEAVEAARVFLRGCKDEQAKTDTMEIMAVALRKKGDWRGSAAAYLKLRDRFENTSDSYARFDGVAEVLKRSPQGVYGATHVNPTSSEDQASGEKPKTLADDEALEAALKALAEGEALKLKGRARTVSRGRLPRDVVTAFVPLAEEFRKLRALSPSVSSDAEHEVAAAAGDRLEALMKSLGAELQTRQTALERQIQARKITNTLKKETEKNKTFSEECARAEDVFQEAMGKLDTSSWAKGGQMVSDSGERRRRYQKFATAFVVPESDYWDFGWW